MKTETLKALKGSIEKWQGIVAGTVEDHGANNCPLCQLFNNDFVQEDELCLGCPVFRKTKKECCDSTPYPLYATAKRRGYKSDMDRHAREELDFLKSLLPKRKRPAVTETATQK